MFLLFARRRTIASMVLIAVFLVGAAACSSDNGEPEATAVPLATATATVAPPDNTNGEPSIRILSPADGATVTTPATIEVAVQGADLALGLAGELVAGGAHWHIYVDGELVPSPYAETSTQVPVSAGDHTLTVALYLNSNDTMQVAANQVEVTVSP